MIESPYFTVWVVLTNCLGVTFFVENGYTNCTFFHHIEGWFVMHHESFVYEWFLHVLKYIV